MEVVNKKDLDKHTSVDVEFTEKLLESLNNRLKTIIEKEAINVSIPKHLDTNKPMWLATDKNGATQIIMCSDKPVRKEEYWAPGNDDYVQAYIDSPFSAKFFGIFWKKQLRNYKKWVFLNGKMTLLKLKYLESK